MRGWSWRRKMGLRGKEEMKKKRDKGAGGSSKKISYLHSLSLLYRDVT